jgi:hypothetical protein
MNAKSNSLVNALQSPQAATEFDAYPAPTFHHFAAHLINTRLQLGAYGCGRVSSSAPKKKSLTS